jgi:PAS domain S-box-containing protein
LPVDIFVWLLPVLTLSLVLLQSLHRRKVAAQIAEGVAEARNILDSTGEGIVTTNSLGEILKFNLAAERIFAYKAENVVGKNFLLLLPEETHAANGHLMSGSGSNIDGQAFELMARRSDGTKFPLSLTIKSIREHGQTVWLGMFRDISARKQAEVNSRKSQRLMEFLLHSSPIVFYTCNVNSGFPVTYVSPNVEKLLGYKPETITSAAAFWPRHIHPDDRDHMQSSRISRLKEGTEELQYRLRLADGSYRWVADSRTMVNDENGQPHLLIGHWTDMHARKEAESNLALKEERLSISLKCANLATWDWVINSGEITWSGQINEKLGFSGKLAADFDDFSAIAHPEDREVLLAAFRQCLVQDESLDIEYRVVWPDKSVHWIHLIGELINDEAGSPVRMAGVLFDITAQKQLRVAPSLGVKRA